MDIRRRDLAVLPDDKALDVRPEGPDSPLGQKLVDIRRQAVIGGVKGAKKSRFQPTAER